MWSYIAASVKGTSHERTGQRLQDAHRCFAADDFLVAVACDGAGSASHGGEGASLAARRVSSLALTHLRAIGQFPDDRTIEAWVDETRDLIAAAANKRKLQPRDFAATLVMAIASKDEVLCAHIGDGAIALRECQANAWTSLSWPENGEYASTTYFLTDENQPRLRISSAKKPIEAIAVMTDGIERLALDFAIQSPHSPFLDVMAAPLQGNVTGRDSKLSKALASFLGSDGVNARTDDDKTLIVATRR